MFKSGNCTSANCIYIYIYNEIIISQLKQGQIERQAGILDGYFI